jgi:hypothetical protein
MELIVFLDQFFGPNVNSSSPWEIEKWSVENLLKIDLKRNYPLDRKNYYYRGTVWL